MSDPKFFTIVLYDIEGYGQLDPVEQAYMRRMLFDINDRVGNFAGIDHAHRLHAERGGVFIELIDAGSSVLALLRALISELPAQLQTVNRMASDSIRIRLRVVVAQGYVSIDEHGGWVGHDLNRAVRLLDAEPLRAALRERENDLVLCVSEDVHQGVVQHDHLGISSEGFRTVTADSKDGTLRAWLHEPARVGTGAAHDTVTGEAVTFGGGLVVGDQVGVVGGYVRDVHDDRTGCVHQGEGGSTSVGRLDPRGSAALSGALGKGQPAGAPCTDVATVPITIYISDEAQHREVEAAVENLLEQAGLTVQERDDPIIGSWFRQMRATVARGLRSNVVREGALTAAHIADRHLVLGPDATVTATLMANLGPLLTSLQPTKDAVLRLGTLLIVKVEWQVTVFQLTAAQQAVLDHQPQLATAPRDVIQALGLPATAPQTTGES
ncbi:hypothetical protein ACWDCB_40375 [Streptomyces sp. NPDC001178]